MAEQERRSMTWPWKPNLYPEKWMTWGLHSNVETYNSPTSLSRMVDDWIAGWTLAQVVLSGSEPMSPTPHILADRLHLRRDLGHGFRLISVMVLAGSRRHSR